MLLGLFAAESAFVVSKIESLSDDVSSLYSAQPLTGELSALAMWYESLKRTLDALSEETELDELQPYVMPLDEALTRVESRFQLNPVFSELGPQIRHLRAEQNALGVRFHAAQNANERIVLQRGAMQHCQSIRRELHSISLSVTQILDRSLNAFVEAENNAQRWSLWTSALVLILGVVSMLYTARLLRPLWPLKNAISRLASGDTSDFPVIKAHAELAELAKEVQLLAQAMRTRDQELMHREQERVNQERLATVGRMTAQITHELRNPLSSIGLNSELLMDELTDGATAENLASARDLLKSITHEVERLREITEEYLRFARLPRPECQAVDLNHLVEELLTFMASELESHNVKARLDPDLGSRFAFIDPNQIRAALFNLVRNAREAMPKGGHVVVRVRTLGDEATIEVEDDGPGLEPDALEHLFEPFFSTKPQGTGLGLSMVRRIVQAQNGDIEVAAGERKGAIVTLHLPLADENDERANLEDLSRVC